MTTLDFVFRQSYVKDVRSDDGGHRATAVAPPSGARRRRLDPGAARALAGAPFPVVGVAPEAMPVAPIDALLPAAMGVQRYEPSNAYNPHRAAPSARSALATHAYVIDGEGVWRFLAERWELVLVGGAPAGMQVNADTFHVALVTHVTALPEGYGELRHALAVLEAGHCLANLVTVGMALGLQSRVHVAFPDGALLALLGVDSADGCVPCAVVSFARDRGDLELPVFPAAPAADAGAPREPVTDAEREAWLDDAAAAVAWTRRSRRGVPAARQRRPLPASSCDLREVLWRRNAGRGAPSLSASLRPIPQAVLWRAVGETSRRDLLWGSADVDGPAVAVRSFWAVARVEGVEPGLYEYVPERDEFLLRRSGNVLARVQQGFSYPPAETSVETANFVGFFVLDPPAIVSSLGARGWRLANLQLGAAAQAAGLALASDGLFARPCRSFHEYVLDEILGLGASEVVTYELLAGVNRFTDFVFDLRP